jgi:hypothetical protein
VAPIGDDDLEARIEEVDEEEADGGERDEVEPAGRKQPVDEERDGDGEASSSRPAATAEEKSSAKRARCGR